jgi:hypothetical protein
MPDCKSVLVLLLACAGWDQAVTCAFPLIAHLLAQVLMPSNLFLGEGPRANKSGGPWRFLPTAANSAEMNPSRKSAVT